jgi:hypothetical protein
MSSRPLPSVATWSISRSASSSVRRSQAWSSRWPKTGQPDLTGVVLHVRKGEVHIGSFLGDLLSFIIIAFVLLMMVKAFKKFRLGNFKAQGQRECDACKEFVAVDASRCKYCTSDLVPVVTDAD